MCTFFYVVFFSFTKKTELIYIVSNVLFFFQFCKNFRVGERCCEFECLDPPGEDNLYQVSRCRFCILPVFFFVLNEQNNNHFPVLLQLCYTTVNYFCVFPSLFFHFASSPLQWRLKKRDEILAGIAGANQILAKALTLILSISSVFILNQFMCRRSS